MTFHYMNSSSSTLVNTHTDINMKHVHRSTHEFGGWFLVQFSVRSNMEL